MLDPQPITPVIIKVVPAPTPEVSVVDILFGAVGLTGLLVVGSILMGLVLGVLIIAYKRRLERRGDPDGSNHQSRLDLSSPPR